MELNQPLYGQGDGGGNTPFDGQNGIDPETGIMYAFGKPVKESKRKPRAKKGETMNFGAKNTPKTGSFRALLGMVGGLVDVQRGSHKSSIKDPTADSATKRVDSDNQ